MEIPYRLVAKSALMSWNGLAEEEANKKIKEESIEQLESQVYAMNSIKYAVLGISNNLNLTKEEQDRFFNAVINGPINDEIFTLILEKTKKIEDINIFALSILSTIHDGWIINNSSEKIFNKKLTKEQLRQYTPLELIGWNEVKSDLLFLNPILQSIGICLDEIKLEDKYHEYVKRYLNDMQITSIENLKELIQQGKNYYPILPIDLSERLKSHINEITSQIISNWEKNDKKSAILFLEVQKENYFENNIPKLQKYIK